MKFSGVNINMLLNNNNNNTNNTNSNQIINQNLINNNSNSNLNYNNQNSHNNSKIQIFPNTQENIFNKNAYNQNSNQNPLFLPPINNLMQFTPIKNNKHLRQNSFDFDFGKRSNPFSLKESLSSPPNQWFLNNINDNNNVKNVIGNYGNYLNNNYNNNNNNFNRNQNNPNNIFYRNDSSNLIDTSNNEMNLLQENLKLKEKISNLENAFMGGNSLISLLPDKNKFSREDFFSEKDDKEDKNNTIVIK
jgi:hypothetical protein